MNQDWFHAEFRAAGHQVVSVGYGRHFEVKIPEALLHIDTVLQLLPEGFTPDAIIAYDESAPILVRGLEECSIPTLFYSVDTHHHWYFHRYLAHVFDKTFVAQKDYVSQFAEVGIEAGWMPLWASRDSTPLAEKKYEVCFVGNMDRKLNPQRVEFFEALKQEVPIHLTLGQWWQLFPESEIVMNQTVKGDLNFRVFEAMISGSLLLTEKSPNGLLELFEDGTHLVTYEKHNVEDAAKKIRSLLADRARCRAIGAAGREEVCRNHLPVHRAQFLLEEVRKLKKKQQPLRYFGAMVNFTSVATKVEKLDPGISTRAALAALECAQKAIEVGEAINSDLACYLIRAALMYDRAMNCRAGIDLIQECSEKYSGAPVFHLVRVRDCLNRGEIQGANEIASLFGIEHTQVFSMAEEVVSSILSVKSGSM